MLVCGHVKSQKKTNQLRLNLWVYGLSFRYLGLSLSFDAQASGSQLPVLDGKWRTVIKVAKMIG